MYNPNLKTYDAKKHSYKGISFKSQLEVKVAILLDYLKADWEYEPRSYDYYFPDFKVKNNRGLGPKTFFIEVKGAFNLKYKKMDYDKFVGWREVEYQRNDEQKVFNFAKKRPIFVIDELPKKVADLNFKNFCNFFWEQRQRKAKNAFQISPFSFWLLDKKHKYGAGAVIPMSDGKKFYLSYLSDDILQIDKIVNYTMAVYNALEEIDFSNYEVSAPQMEIKEFQNSIKEIENEIPPEEYLEEDYPNLKKSFIEKQIKFLKAYVLMDFKKIEKEL